MCDDDADDEADADGNDDADDDAEVVDGNVCTRPVMTYKLSVVAGEYAQPEQRSFLCSTMFCHLDLSRFEQDVRI